LIGDLGAAAVGGAEAVASGVSAAVDVPEGKHADTEDALAAITRIADLEHAADTASELRPVAFFAAISTPDRSFGPGTRARTGAGQRRDGVAGNLLHALVMTDLSI